MACEFSTLQHRQVAVRRQHQRRDIDRQRESREEGHQLFQLRLGALADQGIGLGSLRTRARPHDGWWPASPSATTKPVPEMRARRAGRCPGMDDLVDAVDVAD